MTKVEQSGGKWSERLDDIRTPDGKYRKEDLLKVIEDAGKEGMSFMLEKVDSAMIANGKPGFWSRVKIQLMGQFEL